MEEDLSYRKRRSNLVDNLRLDIAPISATRGQQDRTCSKQPGGI